MEGTLLKVASVASSVFYFVFEKIHIYVKIARIYPSSHLQSSTVLSPIDIHHLY